jgi:hypothetical protein
MYLSTLRGGYKHILISLTLISPIQGLFLGLEDEYVLVRGLSSTVEGMTARERSAPIKRPMLDLVSQNYIVSVKRITSIGTLTVKFSST